MKKQFTVAWNTVMDHRLNPLKHMDLASRHYHHGRHMALSGENLQVSRQGF